MVFDCVDFGDKKQIDGKEVSSHWHDLEWKDRIIGQYSIEQSQKLDWYYLDQTRVHDGHFMVGYNLYVDSQ